MILYLAYILEENITKDYKPNTIYILNKLNMHKFMAVICVYPTCQLLKRFIEWRCI